jgi:hypothetical protein
MRTNELNMEKLAASARLFYGDSGTSIINKSVLYNDNVYFLEVYFPRSQVRVCKRQKYNRTMHVQVLAGLLAHHFGSQKKRAPHFVSTGTAWHGDCGQTLCAFVFVPPRQAAKVRNYLDSLYSDRIVCFEPLNRQNERQVIAKAWGATGPRTLQPFCETI